MTLLTYSEKYWFSLLPQRWPLSNGRLWIIARQTDITDLTQQFEIYQTVNSHLPLQSIKYFIFNCSYNIYFLTLACLGMLRFFVNFSRDLCLDLIFLLSIIFSAFVLLIKSVLNQFKVDFQKFGISLFLRKWKKTL